MRLRAHFGQAIVTAHAQRCGSLPTSSRQVQKTHFAGEGRSSDKCSVPSGRKAAQRRFPLAHPVRMATNSCPSLFNYPSDSFRDRSTPLQTTTSRGHNRPTGLRGGNGGFQQEPPLTSTTLDVLSWSAPATPCSQQPPLATIPSAPAFGGLGEPAERLELGAQLPMRPCSPPFCRSPFTGRRGGAGRPVP
jgi:hypothetical protein